MLMSAISFLGENFWILVFIASGVLFYGVGLAICSMFFFSWLEINFFRGLWKPRATKFLRQFQAEFRKLER